MVNKSHRIIRSIFKKIKSLKLKRYYFECGIILMNAILRSSIYYACETYYNLKETEIRKLERIEEGFLRKLLKTGKGCPITQLYLESGQIPGRFEIIRARLLYLKYILNQNEKSRLYKFFEAQLNNSRKGDWVNMCNQSIQQICLDMSMSDIKATKGEKFRKILKQKINIAALKYLKQKQGSKGKEIDYNV